MSDINGDGYGYKHDWERGPTAQVGSDWRKKSTFYTCRKCAVSFNHYYDVTPYIFDAIREADVPEECK